MLKSSMLPITWLLVKLSCVGCRIGLLQSCIRDADGLGKLLGMKSEGGLAGEMKGWDFVSRCGVVVALVAS